MSNEFKLPGSGYDVVSKVLHAYGLCGDGPTSLKEVAQKAGIDPTMVSRNNGFLKSVGIIKGGREKELTEKGRHLAIAIGNDLEDEIQDRWAEVILDCDETKAIVDMLKIQNGISSSQFSGKMASTLGVINDKNNSTGLNTIEEILQVSNLIRKENDTIYFNESSTQKSKQTSKEDTNKGASKKKEKDENIGKDLENINLFKPDLHINIQIHISPETKSEQIEKIFESMNKYLKDIK